MLSNKLTFSLASLVVLLAFAFVASPVMGQAVKPTATITIIDISKARVAVPDPLPDPVPEVSIKFKIVFTDPIAIAFSGVQYQFLGATNSPLGTAMNVSAIAADPTDGDTETASAKVFIVTITRGSAIGNVIATATDRRITISIPAEAATVVGGRNDGEMNAVIEKDFDLPPVLMATTVKVTGPNELTDPFTVKLAFSKALTTAPMMSDIMVTPKGVTVGTPTIVEGKPMEYTVEISNIPFGTKAVKVSLPTSYVKDGGSVMVPPDTPVSLPVGDGVVTVELTKSEVEYGDYIIIANNATEAEIRDPGSDDDYVIKNNLTYDIENFFHFGGGTIELMGPEGSVAKDIVISEIMWGGVENELRNTPDRRVSQWIELYVAAGDTSAKGVTSATLAKPGEWKLMFTRNKLVATAGAVDSMSNYGLGKWLVTTGNYGQSGRDEYEGGVRLVGDNDTPIYVPAVTAKPYISMYRNINHADLVKTDKTRAEQLKAIPDGTRSGNWKESTLDQGRYQTGLRYATPGEPHVSDLILEGPQTLARDGVVFNEIGNRSAKKNDWIELYNGGTAAKKINGWALSSVTDNDTDTTLFVFESDEDITIPSKGYLLVVNTDPTSTDLAAGENVSDKAPKSRGVSTRYYVNSALDIPEKDFLLVLRTEKKEKSHEKIVDVAGNNGSFALNNKEFATDAWPLKQHPEFAADDITEDDTMSWVRDQSKPLTDGDAWKKAGYTGLGYDRNAEINSGSPGYANDALKEVRVDADGKAQYTGMLSISEIMYDSGNGRAPQWIELYNASATQAVKLNNWTLEIQNYNSEDLDGTLNGTIKFKDDLFVPPNQTVLIVSSTSGRVSPGDVFGDGYLDNRVYSLFDKHADDLDMENRRDTFLSEKGFFLILRTPRPDAKVMDQVGNLDNDRKTRDEPAWILPEVGDDRASLVRVYTGDGEPDDGSAAEGWRSAASIDTFDSDGTYYGDPDDMGSPGWRDGGALPVSLSSFRPARDTATGAVVIRWITESELDNAGFNILRSETKTGEFKVVNLKGIIPGHGTTSEKHVYEWKDTSAKPNVVYYYQIEDVSLDGKRTTLATTHLRGNVNAAGKLTTRWGDLKDSRY